MPAPFAYELVRRGRCALLILALSLAVRVAPAADAPATAPDGGSTEPVASQSRADRAADASWEWETLPENLLYLRYIADPRQAMMKALVLGVLRTDTPDTHSPLLEFAFGGRYGLLRLHPQDEPQLGWQVDAHAGFLGRFDPKANFDAIGWDGYYGLTFSKRQTERLVFKLAYQHDSAHVADEYIAKTGRQRITYTREEAAIGVVYDPLEILRSYAEIGWGFDLSNSGMRPWRLQTGAELRHGMYYAAGDLTFWQERGFRPTTTLQLGLISERVQTSRRYGVAVQFSHGQSILGEFFKDVDRTLGAGWWVDL